MNTLNLESNGDIGIIRLNREVINPINVNMVDDLSNGITEVKSNFRGLALAGGEKFFSLGFDIPELLTLNRSGMTLFFNRFNEILLDLFTLHMPTVCSMRGHAIAGGAILAMVCDYRVAASTKTLIGL